MLIRWSYIESVFFIYKIASILARPGQTVTIRNGISLISNSFSHDDRSIGSFLPNILNRYTTQTNWLRWKFPRSLQIRKRPFTPMSPLLRKIKDSMNRDLRTKFLDNLTRCHFRFRCLLNQKPLNTTHTPSFGIP